MIETAPFRDRRRRVAEALMLSEEVLVVGSGEPIPLPENTDQNYPFRSHAEYYYLAGIACPGSVLVFDPAWGSEDGWVSFVPIISEDQRIWEGLDQQPGRPIEQLRAWLAERKGRPICNLGSPVPGLAADSDLQRAGRARLQHARRPKDTLELDLLKRAAAATSRGHEAVLKFARPGVTERQLQIELEAGFFRGGGDRTGYDSIVASGPNSAVLHFPPSDRELAEGEFLLIDAGAAVERYVCDVTRTHVLGKPSAFQRDLYQIVLDAEISAISRCRPGIEWRDIHLNAAVQMVDGLIAMGLMIGRGQSLVEQAAHTLFFPHGIGHMVGLGVRDASGVALGRKRSDEPALRNLRCDLPLETGYVMTVEPGLYFIPPLLNDPERRERFKHCVNWELVDEHLDAGGIRIEDNLVVTADSEPDVLTKAIPKELVSLPV